MESNKDLGLLNIIDTMKKNIIICIFLFNFRGGGLYNEEGRKTGIWIEISESFNENSQITYIGAYSNGKKQKRWITKFYDIEIGGGNYDNAGQKINLWIELHENFGGGCEVIYQGSYKFGNKCGIWDIQHRQYADNQFQVMYQNLITSGYQMFNEFGLKNGINMELSQIFLNDYQIIYVGSYKNGLKFGQWEIKYRESNVEEFIEIGGGQYNDEGLKIGIWADIDDEFNNFNKYINIGQYILGEKTGQFIVKQLE
ncbi:unnamed protein product (macronuclear) [Paramecium tetraurelia]|uniref:Jacalin-type lectin domain-containing protein n=1 Tax=Paramecium tetraurelia TaxID=5888 RepID=A0EFN6_PARTE|nr:uncharacterized protein GSPATT00026450001 [Paramecium tetraurelia]CAK94127.1 unnamed protein product [Paramecium tetraurelia]|eukprot:XP_001461500.1 hypothetical protein (macronuclear) [Paramecium tetraurelia strain d4-2]